MIPATLVDTLADRYRIERELGTGKIPSDGVSERAALHFSPTRQ